MSIPAIAIASFLIGMGIASIASPRFTASFFGATPDTRAFRNEIRAVYGGFGILLGLLIFYSNFYLLALKPGIALAVATSFWGMALGRLISWIFERVAGWPLFFFLIEVASATWLFFTDVKNFL